MQHASTRSATRPHSASASTSASPVAPRSLPSAHASSVLPSRIKPVPASFYTAKPVYIDSLILLEDLARRTKRALEQANIPIHIASSQTSTTSRRALSWLKLDRLAAELGTPLKTSQYRHIVARLVVLSKYREFLLTHFISGQAGEANQKLATQVEETLQTFSRDTTQVRADGTSSSAMPRHVGVDSLGRAYARGRRKESSARVWVVPAQDVPSSASHSVLVNTLSLSHVFSRVADREAAVYPLRLAGMLGVFNVFALVRGGGTSGQAGAIAHGIAQALVAHFEQKASDKEAVNGAEDPQTKALRSQTQDLRRLFRKGEYGIGILSVWN